MESLEQSDTSFKRKVDYDFTVCSMVPYFVIFRVLFKCLFVVSLLCLLLCLILSFYCFFLILLSMFMFCIFDLVCLKADFLAK